MGNTRRGLFTPFLQNIETTSGEFLRNFSMDIWRFRAAHFLGSFDWYWRPSDGDTLRKFLALLKDFFQWYSMTTKRKVFRKGVSEGSLGSTIWGFPKDFFKGCEENAHQILIKFSWDWIFGGFFKGYLKAIRGGVLSNF